MKFKEIFGITTSVRQTFRFLFINFFKFIVPFGVWVFIFREILTGSSPVDGDALGHYAYVKYFVDNLRVGSFPLWNPFLLLGLPQIFYNSFIGIFNPIWLATFFLNLLGVKIYFAYIYTIILYFFVGVFGFYLFAKAYFQQKRSAYIAFLLLLFSSFGIPILCDLKNIVIFVPVIWFFYFWLRFYQEQKIVHFVGLTFVLMIIAVSYFPPYGFSLVLLTAILTGLFFPRSLLISIKSVGGFFKKHKLVFFICCFVGVISLFPSIKVLDVARNKEVVFPFRAGNQQDVDQKGPEVDLVRSQGLMSTTRGFVNDYLSIGPWHLFYRDITPFYVSIFAYILILLGAFNVLTRSLMIKILLWVILFFIMFIPAGPVHKLLFYGFPGFNLIQGVKSFMPAFIMVFILLAVEQEKKIVEEKFLLSRKTALVFVLFVHLGVFFFVLTRPESIFSSYVSIILSLVYFILILFRKSNTTILMALVCACILLQPLEVLWRYDSKPYEGPKLASEILFYPNALPTFAYQRPLAASSLEPREENLQYDVSMHDAPGIVLSRDFPTRWSYSLLQKSPSTALREYIQNKFYLYDNVVISDFLESDIAEEVLARKKNVAVVHVESNKSGKGDILDFKSLLLTDSKNILSQAQAVEAPSRYFEVVSFGVNSLEIRTNFDKDKFLVYTDSYQSDWKAVLNKRTQRIYRANVAFKGIFLPRGPNNLTLSYAPMGGEYTYWLIFAMYIGMFLWLIVLFFKERNGKQRIDTD
ncbi:MAG: YfhO family protein [Candidatus Omnitrophica bacterium]|nr:YfhO family protein [Candidatus Omnitrophota bacterium]